MIDKSPSAKGGVRALNSTVRRLMRTAALPLAFCVLLAACAAPRPADVPAGPWKYASKVADCISFKPYKGRPYDRTVVLEVAFEKSLMTKLGEDLIPLPRCWYETPDQALLLRSGDFCLNPHWVTFGRSGDAWLVTKVEDPIMSCHQRVRP